MRFALLSLALYSVQAGDDVSNATNTSAIADRMLQVGALVSIPASCPFNNCNSCTSKPGCYWTLAGCSSTPCPMNGPCAFAPPQCGGCQTDSQCGGSPRRCENGQCVGVEGDRACDYYASCAGCLSRPNCLWDPNTVTGSCKPKEQCDFTYQPRELVLSPTPKPALPPATACVKTLDQCNVAHLNGAALVLNMNRGVGCSNHGQCNPDQYCYSCSKCVGSCVRCQSLGIPVAGMCGPAWRCPIDKDSISQTCPIISSPIILAPVLPPAPVVSYPAPVVSYPAPVVSYPAPVLTATVAGKVKPKKNKKSKNTQPVPVPPVAYSPPVVVSQPVQVSAPGPVAYSAPLPAAPSCNFLTCSTCTNAFGCVWSGTSCYYTTVPCTNPGCANTPQTCPPNRLPVVTTVVATVPVSSTPVSSTSNCAFNNCQNCAAAQGCAWSGQFCYYAVSPCTTPGCANTPAQCGGCTQDSQCGAGFRCNKGVCLDSPGDRTCDYYTDCVNCLANANCLWDPNSNTHCKPKAQCDFTVRGLTLTAGPSTLPPATACVRTVDKCSQTNFNGALLSANQDRGAGCTNHGQCLNGQYCFSCSKCRGNCSPCQRPGGAPVSGACAPASQCPIDLDSIDGSCPL